jgi:signal transduction histidine kinase
MNTTGYAKYQAAASFLAVCAILIFAFCVGAPFSAFSFSRAAVHTSFAAADYYDYSAQSAKSLEPPDECDAVRRARLEGDRRKLALALAECAYDQWVSSPETGIEMANEALQIARAEGFWRGEARALAVLGWFLYMRSDYAEAMESYLRAESLAQEARDTLNMSFIKQCKGNLFRRVFKDYNRAYREHLESFFLLAQTNSGDSLNTMILHQEIAIDLNNLGRPAEALPYLTATIDFFARRRDTANLCVSVGYIGRCYVSLQRYDSALSYTNRALELAAPQKFRRPLTFLYSQRADIWNALQKPDSAVADALAAKEYALNATTRDNLPDIYVALGEAERQRGNYKAAFEAQALAKAAMDSLSTDKIRNTLVMVESEYALGEAERRLLRAETENRAQRYLLGSLAVIGIAALTVGVLSNRWARREKNARVLLQERSKKITEQAAELQALNERLIKANQEVVAQLQAQAEQAQRLKFSQVEIQEKNEELAVANNELRVKTEILEAQQEALQSANEELERRNEELAQAETFRLKMLAIVSHDLKNPIDGVTGLAEYIANGLEGASGAEGLQEAAQEIARTGEKMRGLVRDFLDIAALNSVQKKNIRWRAVSLNAALTETLRRHEIAAQKKRQTFAVAIEEGLFALGDYERLLQVFDNLVSNAVKYATLESVIHISAQRRNGAIEARIRNAGQGFSESDKTRIFTFFQPLSARPTGGEKSSGVGLAIVKHILDAHGGSIEVESSEGEGATMIVRLPLAEG